MNNTVYLLYDWEEVGGTTDITVFSDEVKATKALLVKLLNMIQNDSEYCEDLKEAVFEVINNRWYGNMQDIEVAGHNFLIERKEVN